MPLNRRFGGFFIIWQQIVFWRRCFCWPLSCLYFLKMSRVDSSSRENGEQLSGKQYYQKTIWRFELSENEKICRIGNFGKKKTIDLFWKNFETRLIWSQLLRIDKNDRKKTKKIIFSEYEVAIFGKISVLMFKNSMAMMLIID